MTETKSRVDTFELEHNVTLWLHRMDTERQLHQWPDAVAIAEASMNMGDSPLTWFLANAGRIHTWAEFEFATKQRFADSEQTIMARIQHRKQCEDESVQSYADDMHMMMAQSVFPDVLKRDLLLDNMKPSLRKQVMTSIPTTVEEVIANALFLEERAAGATPEKTKQREQQRYSSRMDLIERLTKSMEKMSMVLYNCFHRQGNIDYHMPDKQDKAPPYREPMPLRGT